MSKRDKITFALLTVLFFVVMIVGSMKFSVANFTAMLVIFLIAYLIYCGYLLRKHFAATKKLKERRLSRYGATLSGNLKHISGLPLAKGVLVEVFYTPDKIVFKKDKQEITISRDKITDIDLVMPENSSRKALSGAATGKYVYGGKTGAALGALSSISPNLTISYISDGKNKHITFDTQSSGTFPSKLVKDFAQTHTSPTSSIEL